VIDLAVLQIVLRVRTGWLDYRERDAIAYLIEENQLRRRLGERRPRLTDDDRRLLAARAYRVGREALREIATVATPDTLLRWHRQLNRPEVDIHQGNRHGAACGSRSASLSYGWRRNNPAWGYTRIQGAPQNVGIALVVDHSADSSDGGPAVGPAAADLMADVLESTLGRDCRRRLLHDGSVDVARLGHVLHGVPH
jgi:hypothetical protein